MGNSVRHPVHVWDIMIARGILVAHWLASCAGDRQVFSSRPHSTLTFPQWSMTWVITGLGMSNRVCATGHIKYPVPLIEKSRVSCPSGSFHPCLIYQ